MNDLPYGIHNLDPHVICDERPEKRVCCYVQGCDHFLRPVGRRFAGDVCPKHEIRCHYSAAGATYAYVDVRRNIIASPDTFAKQIVGHPFKYESHRLSLERSEDALSWNVFRSLQEAARLAQFGALITGQNIDVEPSLYLWGICTTQDEFRPWDLLIAARNRFECNLPVERPLTEPDIALHLPGQYLILIEAKFTSPNTCYKRGPRKDRSSLTLEELVRIYQDPSLNMLDIQQASSAERIYYQLWRNLIFAEFMAQADHPKTKAFHVNLVRAGYDVDSASEFHDLVRPAFKDRFQRITWEQIYQLFKGDSQLSLLRSYLETKSAGLQPAFCLN